MAQMYRREVQRQFCRNSDLIYFKNLFTILLSKNFLIRLINYANFCYIIIEILDVLFEVLCKSLNMYDVTILLFTYKCLSDVIIKY